MLAAFSRIACATAFHFASWSAVILSDARRLVIRWQHQNKPELKAEGPSLCTMELEPTGGAVKLSITHTIDAAPSKFIQAVSGGWPKVISNLKSLLETGSVALDEPYPVESARMSNSDQAVTA